MKKLIYIMFFFIVFASNVFCKDYLTGNVSDISNSPVDNAKVVLGNFSERDLYVSPLITFTDSNGKYTFSNIIPGLQSIEVEKEGYKIFGDTITLKNRANFYNVRLQKEEFNFNNKYDHLFEVEKKNILNGTVKNSVTKEPIEGVNIVFADSISRTDKDGRFSMELEDNSKDFLIIQGRKYQIYQKLIRPKKNMDIYLQPEIPYSEVYGTVIKAEDLTAVSNINVKIGNKEAVTDVNGRYFFKDILSGEYPIMVDNEKFKKYSDVVKIYQGKQNYDIILRERLKYGHIFGYVKKRSNLKPLSNALVAVGTVSLKTDNDGFFELYGVVAKKSEIVVIYNSEEIYRSDIWVQEGKQQYDIIY